MEATNSSFRYVEYTGPDAADVLVTLLMNLAHGGAGEGGEVIDGGSETQIKGAHERVVGFMPNQQTDEEEGEEDAERTVERGPEPG